MVIGNGMIAKQFTAYSENDAFVIFASGVSNSDNNLDTEFEKEEQLLLNTIQHNEDKILVYFSTCSITDQTLQQKKYVKHKLSLENKIIQLAPKYHIFRLSNPVGKTKNKHTLIDFFINCIQENIHFSIWEKASRNIIDIEDMYKICDFILQNNMFTNSIVNIANPVSYPIKYIVKTIESHFNLQANYSVEEKGGSPIIDVREISPIFQDLNITFTENYFPDLLKKYFPSA